MDKEKKQGKITNLLNYIFLVKKKKFCCKFTSCKITIFDVRQQLHRRSAERALVKVENDGAGVRAPPGVYLCTCLQLCRRHFLFSFPFVSVLPECSCLLWLSPQHQQISLLFCSVWWISVGSTVEDANRPCTLALRARSASSSSSTPQCNPAGESFAWVQTAWILLKIRALTTTSPVRSLHTTPLYQPFILISALLSIIFISATRVQVSLMYL